MILDVTYRSHTFIHSSSCLSRYGYQTYWPSTKLRQDVSCPTPTRQIPKLFQVASWLWAVWQVLGLGCRVHFISCWKGLVYCLKKTPSSLELAEKKLQVKLCFFLEGSPILEATTKPRNNGGFPTPEAVRQENWPSVEHWVTFCWKIKAWDLKTSEQWRIPWLVRLHREFYYTVIWGF